MNKMIVPRHKRGRESLRAYFRRLDARLSELHIVTDPSPAEIRERMFLWVESAHLRPGHYLQGPRGAFR